ncbi:hypothetical protein [Pontibacterium sp.]|uniref:hypothetical protein n=1 Tax=Pontibacterium sp. TaxID=2036026 RepID=UPI00356317B0
MTTVTAIDIRPDGWSADVTISGWAGQQGNVGYDFAGFSLLVTSEGYSGAGAPTTVTRTVLATTPVRQVYPNEALLEETDSGPDLIVRVALSQCVYDDDKDGGVGTSGVDPVATVPASWASIAGGSTDSASLVASNSSAVDYPKVIGQWDMGETPVMQRVEDDFPIAFRARHGFGVAAAVLSAIGAASAHQEIATETALSLISPLVGKHREAYKINASIDGFTQGEEIILRAAVYPVIGDADSVLDTEMNTDVNDHPRGLTRESCYCDKTGAMKQYAVVDTAGIDASGVVSGVLAEADESPYLTIGGALAGGANVIYCNDGAHDILGVNPASVAALDYAIEVMPHPSSTAVQLNRSGNARSYKAKRLMYRNLPINYTSGNGWLDGENNDQALIFKQVAFNSTATPTVGLAYRSKACHLIGCTGLGTDHYESFSTSRVAYTFTDCEISSRFKTTACYAAVGNRSAVGGLTSFQETTVSNAAPAMKNLMLEHNALMDVHSSTDATIRFGSDEALEDVSLIGNVVEVSTVITSQPAMFVGADSSTVPVRNVLIAHNTVTGERNNWAYNDEGATANVRENLWFVGNAVRSFNIKGDVFHHPVDGKSGGRIGNRAMMCGVNCWDNRYDGAASSTFVQDYAGRNVEYVDQPDQVFGQMGYTDEQSSDVGGGGNGDYMPASGSPLVSILADSFISYDQNGNPVSSQIGALFIPRISTKASSLSLGLNLSL